MSWLKARGNALGRPGSRFFKERGMAALAGFEGEKLIEEKIDEHTAAQDDSAPTT
jgi:hypothetical protein